MTNRSKSHHIYSWQLLVRPHRGFHCFRQKTIVRTLYRCSSNIAVNPQLSKINFRACAHEYSFLLDMWFQMFPKFGSGTNIFVLVIPVMSCLSLAEPSTTPSDKPREVTSSPKCIWYGEGKCTLPTKNGLSSTCNYHYEGPPKPLLSKKANTTFRSLCHSMLNKDGSVPSLCCDEHQIERFAEQIEQAELLVGRCPPCWENLLGLYCRMTCSPKKSQFMYIYPENRTLDQATGQYLLGKVGVALDQEYATLVYDSCKDVEFGGVPAMTLMCAAESGLGCTPRLWLDYIGNSRGLHVPFDFNFTLAAKPMRNEFGGIVTPLRGPAYCCNQAPPKSSACDPGECGQTCPDDEIFGVNSTGSGGRNDTKPRKRREVLDPGSTGFDNPWIICIVLYSAFAGIFVAYLVFSHRRTQDAPASDAAQNFHLCGKTSLGNRGGLCPKRLQDSGLRLERFLQKHFYSWGKYCADNPLLVILSSTVLLTACAVGWMFFSVVSDPVLLWSAPSSRARMEKDYFDQHFGPFYRIGHIIIRPKNTSSICSGSGTCAQKDGSHRYSGVFRKEVLEEIFRLEEDLLNLEAHLPESSPIAVAKASEPIRLRDLCDKPLANNTNCLLFSVTQYFQGNATKMQQPGSYINHIDKCCRPNLHRDCFGTAGAPSSPRLIFGGFAGALTGPTGHVYGNATALIITIPLENSLNKTHIRAAEAWEAAAIDYLKIYDQSNLTISFSLARSAEDEIQRMSEADINTVLISHFVVFVYVAATLGQYQNWKRCLVDSKITLGLVGVVIVFASFGASVGFYSYCGLSATLISIEVIPFLVLAVGVDNIFILVQTYQRETTDTKNLVEEKVARVVGKVGPSMLLTSLSEACCFSIGALSSMPAVKLFSLSAAMAIFINFLLQISCFVSVMTLDTKRQQSRRMDSVCCLKGPPKTVDSSESWLHYVINRHYAPFVTRPWVRPFIVLLFGGWFMSSVAVINKISIGFDQKNSMPEDSYVLNYMKNMESYLDVGAPVYFVLDSGLNFSEVADQNLVCAGPGCSSESLVRQINEASQHSASTRIIGQSPSWLDDFISWWKSGSCCQVFKNDSRRFCPGNEVDRYDLCKPCDTNALNGRPNGTSFMELLPFFLRDSPRASCSRAGSALHGKGVRIINNGQAVGPSQFRTDHTVCRNSKDYTNAMLEARLLADEIAAAVGVRVFPYSIFYVYYEQYLTIAVETVEHLTLSLVAIFLASFFLLGLDWHSALLIVGTITMIEVNMMGVLYWWNIELNAISLVNLVMAVGISVEFCSHLVRAFALDDRGSRVQRARNGLSEMGSSVFSGITLTKFGGIMVLAFSHSQIFRIYYFRMYLSIVLIGGTHGLIFLPVLLSYLGPGPRQNSQRMTALDGDHVEFSSSNGKRANIFEEERNPSDWTVSPTTTGMDLQQALFQS